MKPLSLATSVLIFVIGIVNGVEGANSVGFATEAHPSNVSQSVFVLDITNHDNFPSFVKKPVNRAWAWRFHIYDGLEGNPQRLPGNQYCIQRNELPFLRQRLAQIILAGLEEWERFGPREYDSEGACEDLRITATNVNYCQATLDRSAVLKAKTEPIEFPTKIIRDTDMPDVKARPISYKELSFSEINLLFRDTHLTIHRASLSSSYSDLNSADPSLPRENYGLVGNQDDRESAHAQRQYSYYQWIGVAYVGICVVVGLLATFGLDWLLRIRDRRRWRWREPRSYL